MAADEAALEPYDAVSNPTGVKPRRIRRPAPHVRPAFNCTGFVRYAAAVSPFEGTFAEEGIGWEDDAGFLTDHVGPPAEHNAQDAFGRYGEALPGREIGPAKHKIGCSDVTRLRPVFLVAPPARIDNAAAAPPSHARQPLVVVPDRTKFLTKAQAIKLRKECLRAKQGKTRLTQIATTRELNDARDRSATVGRSLFGNDPQNVRVFAGEAWALFQRSHRMMRCGYRAFCTSCGSCTVGGHSTALQMQCVPKLERSTYHKYTLRDLLRGKCPYKKGWHSGLDRKVVWPPLKLLCFLEDASHSMT